MFPDYLRENPSSLAIGRSWVLDQVPRAEPEDDGWDLGEIRDRRRKTMQD